MTWITLALAAYLILAVVQLADKIFLDKFLTDSFVYAFVISILGGVAVLLAAPWLCVWPGWLWLALDLLIGATFTGGLLLLFAALRRGDASRVLTIIGGAMPLFSAAMSYGFGERLSRGQVAALLLLVIGVVVMAWEKAKPNVKKTHGLGLALAASLTLALFFVGTKQAYVYQPFASSFIWIRLGAGIGALFLLVSPALRRALQKNKKKLFSLKGVWFLLAQLFGALGYCLQSYAINLGSVSLVNALQGVQYVFLLIFAAIGTLLYPKLLKEKLNWQAVVQKVAAVGLIGAGLYLLLR